MLMNHTNFHFTQIPDKTNDVIFLKSPETMFLGQFLVIFYHFCLMGIFSKKFACHTQLCMGPQDHAKFRKKLMSQSQENLQKTGRTDGRMDKPCFIGPFRLRPGVQLNFSTINSISKPFKPEVIPVESSIYLLY